MKSLSLFLKKNKAKKENAKYIATKSLCDATGKPLEWEIKPLTTKESEDVRESCTIEVPVTGKTNVYRNKLLTSKYNAKLLAKSVVFPDLYNAELQDSYGVKTPEELIVEMIDDAGEYARFLDFVVNLNGFSKNMDEEVEEAKN